MTAPILIACPSCATQLEVMMTLNEDGSNTVEEVKRLLGEDIIQFKGNYEYAGYIKCQCDLLVLATLIVSAHTHDQIEF